MLDDRIYKLHLAPDGWKCEQVPKVFCDAEFSSHKEQGLNIIFTIRRFANGVGFLLYSPCAAYHVVKRQADYMSQHPAP